MRDTILLHLRVVGCADPSEAEGFARSAINRYTGVPDFDPKPARTGHRRMVFRCFVPRGHVEPFETTIDGVEITCYILEGTR